MASKGSLRHVEVFWTGGVEPPSSGGLDAYLDPVPARCFTLICDEPLLRSHLPCVWAAGHHSCVTPAGLYSRG
jgi:hypothetical protein